MVYLTNGFIAYGLKLMLVTEEVQDTGPLPDPFMYYLVL